MRSEITEQHSVNPSSQSLINASPKSSRDNVGNSNNSSATQASGNEIGNSIHDSSGAAQSSENNIENSSDESQNAAQPSEYYRSGLLLYNTHTLVLTFVCANTCGYFSINYINCAIVMFLLTGKVPFSL